VRRILIIEDEAKIASFVVRALTASGYHVERVESGRQGLELIETGQYELVVLDLLLPDMDGSSVLRAALASRPEQCVLVLSALSDVESKVQCLELGASDYLQKPFALAELLARVHVRLRQSAGVRASERVLSVGDVTLELARREAHAGNGPIHLSEREFLVLRYLMRKRGDVCTREELLGDVWGYSFDPGTNVVDVYVRRLRAKLGNERIETVRNVGYSFHAA
jgi:DNA-binding response OmpR family regulator